MRDSDTTRFTKSARLTPEHHILLLRIKGKKTIAGKLEEIIDYWKDRAGKENGKLFGN